MFCYFTAKPFLAILRYKSTTKNRDTQTLLYNNKIIFAFDNSISGQTLRKLNKNDKYFRLGLPHR